MCDFNRTVWFRVARCTHRLCMRFGHGVQSRRTLELMSLDFVTTSTYAGLGTFELAAGQTFDELDARARLAGLPVGTPCQHGTGVSGEGRAVQLGSLIRIKEFLLCVVAAIRTSLQNFTAPVSPSVHPLLTCSIRARTPKLLYQYSSSVSIRQLLFFIASGLCDELLGFSKRAMSYYRARGVAVYPDVPLVCAGVYRR
jgi:hypothetical protein